MKSIYEYLDYRKYLKDYFAEQKESSSFFSFRYVEKRINVDASNLSKIVQGKRHISDLAFKPFVELLKLDEKESGYFNLLIKFSKSRSDSKRREFFEMLMNFNAITANRVQESRYEFYQKWYYTAVLALLYFFPAKYGEWRKIGQQLTPTITEDQAKEAVELLERLNFIKVSSNGNILHTDSIITSGEQYKSVILDSFQKQSIKLALDAMDRAKAEERYISTLSVTLSKESYQKIKAITAEYRKAVLKEVAESDKTDRVYQINLQLFPLSEKWDNA